MNPNKMKQDQARSFRAIGAVVTLFAAVSIANAGIPVVGGPIVLPDAVLALMSQPVRLTASNVLLNDPDPTIAKFLSCQPLQGEHVKVLDMQQVPGMPARVLRVAVAEGRCKGVEGWVGSQRVEVRHD